MIENYLKKALTILCMHSANDISLDAINVYNMYKIVADAYHDFIKTTSNYILSRKSNVLHWSLWYQKSHIYLNACELARCESDGIFAHVACFPR